MACSLSTINNHTRGFDFEDLFTLYLYLNQTCAPESDIFFPGTRMLTEAVCRKITRTSRSIWTGFTKYPISDAWNRIVTWKLPLCQLVAQYPRAPLGFDIEAATLFHLLGDPIDSMTSMLVTLAICHSRAKTAKELCQKLEIKPFDPEYERRWKALAILMVSYDDCGRPEKVNKFRDIYLKLRLNADIKEDLWRLYEETAFSLAADRSTKSLPVVFAEAIFIGGWVIALVKAASSDPSPTNWANVEAHSVALSALYLWVTSAVALGSVIGVSQTERAIPRLLQGFENRLWIIQKNREDESSATDRNETEPCRTSTDRGINDRESLPSVVGDDETEWCRTSADRAIHGGVYSWRPMKWKHIPNEFDIGMSTLISYAIVSIILVGIGFVTGALLSYFVTPRGPSCRHVPESLIFFLWLLSFVLECILEHFPEKYLSRTVFWKDTFFALCNISIVLAMQWGMLNRCACWSMWGLTGLHLPQLPEVKPALMNYIRHVAPWIVSAAILFQIIFCAGVTWTYWDAVRVYIQRDDGLSNFPWLVWWRRRDEHKVVLHDEN